MLSLTLMGKVRSADCFTAYDSFPKVLGGFNDVTQYNTIEISTDGSIAVGGYSKSSDLTTFTSTRSVLSMLTLQGSYSWSKRIFGTLTTSISAIAFKADNSEVIAIMGTASTDFYVVRFTKSSGNFIKGYTG